MPDNSVDENWKLCCSSAHKNEIVFFTQVFFLFLIALFAMCQIIRGDDNTEIYYSLLSSVVGIIVPAPSLDKNK